MVYLSKDFDSLIRAHFASDPRVIRYETEYLKAGSIFSRDGREDAIEADMLRVQLALSAEEGSYLRIEAFFPETWEGRFLGFGNGGMAGGLPVSSLIRHANLHRVTCVTDLGTSRGQDSGIRNFAVARDFGHRATHLMTVYSKVLARLLYGEDPAYSYFFGGSTGGEQALSEAQRYPEDYDAISAGAPADNRIALHTYFIWNFIHTHSPDGKPLFDEALTRKIHSSAIAYAQAHGDGEKGDRFITMPYLEKGAIDAMVDFIVSSLSLSDDLAFHLRALYQGPTDSRGNKIYNGIPASGELYYCGISNTAQMDISPFPYPFIWVMGQDFDPFTFDFDDDFQKVSSTLSPHMDANDPDLRPFLERGGKLLIVSGTADPCVPFQDAYFYSEKVQSAVGEEKAKKGFRFFLIPSFDHGRAAGLDNASLIDDKGVNIYDALFAWREKGIPIDAVTASLRGYDEADDHLRTISPLIPRL